MICHLLIHFVDAARTHLNCVKEFYGLSKNVKIIRYAIDHLNVVGPILKLCIGALVVS